MRNIPQRKETLTFARAHSPAKQKRAPETRSPPHSMRYVANGYAILNTQPCLSSTAPSWMPVRVSRSFFMTGPISS